MTVECDHGTAPLRHCLLCCCQSKWDRWGQHYQCELDPQHDGDHYYAGGLEADFAITWAQCMHAFLGDGKIAVWCVREGGHDGAHRGTSVEDIDFEATDDPKRMEITQTFTMQEVLWYAGEGQPHATDPT